MLLGRIGVAVVILATFAAVSAAMFTFLPEPLRPVDYMLAGSVATMASLITTFLAVGPIGAYLANRKHPRGR